MRTELLWELFSQVPACEREAAWSGLSAAAGCGSLTRPISSNRLLRHECGTFRKSSGRTSSKWKITGPLVRHRSEGDRQIELKSRNRVRQEIWLAFGGPDA